MMAVVDFHVCIALRVLYCILETNIQHYEVFRITFDLPCFGNGVRPSDVWHPRDQHVSGWSSDGSCRQLVCQFLNVLSPSLSAFSVCFAKHVNDKAAKWAKSKRPRKSRPSDINRKPIIYEIHSMTKPAEYSISDAPASPMAKPTPAGN